MTKLFNEDGVPVFIDTSGHLSAEQKADIFRMIAHLQESDYDNRQWLRELNQKLEDHISSNREWNYGVEVRIDEFIESLSSKKRWWQVWKR